MGSGKERTQDSCEAEVGLSYETVSFRSLFIERPLSKALVRVLEVSSCGHIVVNICQTKILCILF